MTPLFELRDLTREYRVRTGLFSSGKSFRAVQNVSLDLLPGVFYGLVGESGSGKTTLARILAGLIEKTSGSVRFEGRPLQESIRDRGRPYFQKVQMIFQNPYLSLDPRWKVSGILQEGILYLSRAERIKRTEEVLDRVGLSRNYLARRPAALSGGERQRVAIARALAVRPEYLILDEPTSQLDVSVQAQILRLLEDLRPVLKGGILFVTHDIALIGRQAEKLIIMREGRVIEEGSAAEVLHGPKNEYTRRLIAAVPRLKKNHDV